MSDAILDTAALICLLLAAILSAAAGIGLLRFTDVLSRLHAATKPQIFGLLLVIAAVALDQRSFGVLLALVPVFVFQSLTAPAAAHMVGRAAYRTGQLDDDTLMIDELGPAVRRANETAVSDAARGAEAARAREIAAVSGEGLDGASHESDAAHGTDLDAGSDSGAARGDLDSTR